ncbi:MAG: PIN domain-containing protein, partial [Rubrobacteraceae bacterium]
SIPRNRVEARAVEELLGRVLAGDAELVSSFVVKAEHSRLSEPARRVRVGNLISFARKHVTSNTEILERATALEEIGFGAGDALHIAAAEHAGVDYFVTCDDKLISKARRTNLLARVILPQELIEENVI